MGENPIKIKDVEISAESFGKVTDPPILLIMGATASMLWWDAEFCEQLAAQNRFVIRFDNRDVGRSTVYEAGTTNYTVGDLAADAFGILDAYGIEKAHVVGMSLGGLIAQVMILQNAARVLTVTLISTTIFGSENEEIPEIDEKILEYFGKVETVDWTDEKSATDFMIGNWRLQHGSRHEFDEAAAETLAHAEFERAKNLPSMFNHAQLGEGDDEYLNRADEIKTPTLIIHGTEDLVNNYEHAKVLAQEIENSKLLTIENGGHEIHREDWKIIIGAIAEHTK